MRRVALILGLATCATAGAIGAFATAAAADCSGPLLDFTPTSVGRGEQLTVTGEAFGDNCYDTGPPPAGEGTLGKPIADIEIVLVQGETEHVVAQGNADEDYRFTVDVVVPAVLRPGAVDLQARAANQLTARSYDPLVISDAPLRSSAIAEIAIFGPAAPVAGEAPAEADPESTRAAETAESAGSSDNDDGPSNALPIAAGAVALAAVAAAVIVLVQRRRRGRTD